MVTQTQRRPEPDAAASAAAAGSADDSSGPRAGLAGRVAIVTGVGPSVESGSIENIGLAVARRLLADGCTVVGCDVLDGAAALAAAAAEVAAGDRASFTLCDVTDTAAVRALVAGVAAQNGGAVDLLVCVAGVGVETGGVDTLTEEHMDFVVDVNLKGVMRFNRACVPLMKAAGRGAIVNISSQLAISARPGMPVYTATKGGVAALSRALAVDHAEDGIRVNAVCPGVIVTPMGTAGRGSMADAGASDLTIARTPMRRRGMPAEVAAAVSFLLSDDASYITGVSLPVDGGWTAS
jgi:NAD(P)-dependent dehydrogenase (short-subunit alcohol dehydrogenase family)